VLLGGLGRFGLLFLLDGVGTFDGGHSCLSDSAANSGCLPRKRLRGFEDNVGVVASESKARDANERVVAELSAAMWRQREFATRHFHGLHDAGVHARLADGERGYDAALEHEHGLEQAQSSGSALEVPEVHLRSGEEAR